MYDHDLLSSGIFNAPNHSFRSIHVPKYPKSLLQFPTAHVTITVSASIRHCASLKNFSLHSRRADVQCALYVLRDLRVSCSRHLVSSCGQSKCTLHSAHYSVQTTLYATVQNRV